MSCAVSSPLQLLDWHIHLDKSLPGLLGVIGAWLHRAEIALREDIPLQQAHEETANIIHRKLEQHRVCYGEHSGKKSMSWLHWHMNVKMSCVLNCCTVFNSYGMSSIVHLCFYVYICVDISLRVECSCVFVGGAEEPRGPQAGLPADPQGPICQWRPSPPRAAAGPGREVW